jgi:hypothetical protein
MRGFFWAASSAAAALMEAKSARSSCRTEMAPGAPEAAISSATFCPAGTLREHRMTRAPAVASARTVSTPCAHGGGVIMAAAGD